MKPIKSLIKDAYTLGSNKKSCSKSSGILKRTRRIVKKNGWRFKNTAGFIAANVIKRFNKDEVWIVGERGGKTANDTSYYFYKSLHDRKCKASAYYVIKKDSPTRNNLEGMSNIIDYGSLKHFIVFHLSDVCIFSDSMKDVFWRWRENFHKYQKKKVFLQHGVFALNRACGYYDKNSMLRRGENPDLFIVSSNHEKRLICDQFGFSDHEVAVTGLSRFDSLPKRAKSKTKTISFIPTWREWLAYGGEDKLKESVYYKRIFSIATNERLNDELSKVGYKINLCLHHSMHKFVDSFAGLDNINVLSMHDIDVQSLIKTSDMLITDYSSISFDFLYQGKPVLFYWFDHLEFFAKRGGPLVCPIKDMPGKVSFTEDELIDAIVSKAKKGCVMTKANRTKGNKFFTYKDRLFMGFKELPQK